MPISFVHFHGFLFRTSRLLLSHRLSRNLYGMFFPLCLKYMKPRITNELSVLINFQEPICCVYALCEHGGDVREIGLFFVEGCLSTLTIDKKPVSLLWKARRKRQCSHNWLCPSIHKRLVHFYYDLALLSVYCMSLSLTHTLKHPLTILNHGVTADLVHRYGSRYGSQHHL